MRLKKIEPVSLGKILGIMYAVLGLFAGLIISIVFIIGAAVGMRGSGMSPFPPFISVFFGIGSVILFPVLYGVLGLVSGIVSAIFYNILAARIGGIDMEFEDSVRPSANVKDTIEE